MRSVRCKFLLGVEVGKSFSSARVDCAMQKKLEANNLCGYDLVIFQDDKKECEDEIFMKGASQQLIIASVKDSFSLDDIEGSVSKI